MMAALRLQEASIGYGERLILRQITLELHPGEILGVVGPNGVGKSTLIRAASGVLPLAEGQILLGGQDVAELSHAQRAQSISVVPQATQLPKAFRARDVVLMGRTPFLGWLSKEDQVDYRIAEEAMERTGTVGLAMRSVGELSGGEQQRLLIARALAQTPAVLLLDEPTAHLDLRHQDEILSLIRTLVSESGLAVLLALHDLNLVARFTDRVALLSDGGIRRAGIPKEVLIPEELAAVYGIAIHVTDHPIHGTPLVLS